MRNTKVLSMLLAVVILLPFGVLSENALEEADNTADVLALMHMTVTFNVLNPK